MSDRVELTETDTSVPQGRPTALGVGSVVAGRFEIRALLGQGGMGAVYRAQDRVAAEEVALKVLFADADDAVARVRQELRTARLVTHPGVVRIHDLVEDGHRLLLSMEIVEGESLAARLEREKTLDAEAAWRLARELAASLAAAHEAGVVHRDLKPANVLLRRSSGRAVLTDFGVSRLATAAEALALAAPALSRTGQIAGTPLYMAPEQFAGEATPASDVYAYGLVLHEVACGKVPHAAPSVAALMNARLGEPPPALDEVRPDLAPELRALIVRCLARDPAQRPRDGAALVEALGSPTGVAAPPRSRRRPWVLAAVALALLAGGAIVLARPSLPARDRRVSVVPEVRGIVGVDLAAALGRMAERVLADEAGRYRVGSGRDGNVTLRLLLEPTSEGARLRADLGPAGETPVLTLERSAASAEAALDELGPTLRSTLGEGQPPKPQAAADLKKDMARVGAQTEAAYRAYSAAIRELYGQVAQDTGKVDAGLAGARRAQPGWSHAILAAAMNEMASRARVHALLAQADRTTDERGYQLFEAWAAMLEDRVDEGAAKARALYVADPDDLLAVSVFAQIERVAGRMEVVLSTLRRAHERWPDLQFGAETLTLLRRMGRSGEAGAFVEDWLRRAPDSEQALIQQALVGQDADEGRPERVMRGLLVLRGENPARRELLADALIVARRWDEAARLADRVLVDARAANIGDGDATARLRIAMLATLRGRFANARLLLQPLLARTERTDLARITAHSMLGSTALALGETHEAARHFHALTGSYSGLSSAARWAANTKMLADVTEGSTKACPDVPAMMRRLESSKSLEALTLARMAAGLGCAPCALALQLGGGNDGDPVATFFYGDCALRAGQLEQARVAFESLRAPRTASADGYFLGAPAYTVLALHRLGLVYEKLGRREDAKRSLSRFVEQWADAERPIAALGEARAALARLQ